MGKSQVFYIYILECEDGSFYTGFTKHLDKRYRAHVHGTGGAKYTRIFKPVRIAGCWKLSGTIGSAMKIERFVKKRGRSFKESLVRNPGKLKGEVSEKYRIDLDIAPCDPPAGEGESS